MKGYGIIWPHDVDRSNPPTDGQIFDLLEFSYEFIAGMVREQTGKEQPR